VTAATYRLRNMILPRRKSRDHSASVVVAVMMAPSTLLQSHGNTSHTSPCDCTSARAGSAGVREREWESGRVCVCVCV
jgi:hypothetical protein